MYIFAWVVNFTGSKMCFMSTFNLHQASEIVYVHKCRGDDMKILHYIYLLLSNLQLLFLALHISPQFFNLEEKNFMIMMTIRVVNTYDYVSINLCDICIFVITIFCHWGCKIKTWEYISTSAWDCQSYYLLLSKLQLLLLALATTCHVIVVSVVVQLMQLSLSRWWGLHVLCIGTPNSLKLTPQCLKFLYF